jgi:DNA-binding transcriptional LysR family regulator
MRNLTLKQLQAVAAVARLGTITRAAQELHITPAALTSRIQQLEAEVGLSLFDRTNTGLKVTDAGREMLSAIDSINVAIEACIERLDALKGVAGGRVAIGAVSTAKYFAPQAIAGFSRAHPAVEISLLVGNRAETIASLRSYDLDLAIMGRPPHDFAVQAEPIGDHPLVIIAHPEHCLAGRRGLKRANLVDEAFLVREDGSGTRTVFEEFMAGLVVKRPRFGIDAGSNETIKQAVMAGLGIALISGHTVATELADGRLTMLDVEGLPVRRRWFAVRRSDKVLGPAATALWQVIIERGSDFLPDLPGSKLPPEARLRIPAASRAD